MTDPRSGNLFEVFHYPSVTKDTQLILKTVYKQYPPRDDFAFACTDVQMDELFPGEGGSSGALNSPVNGIGGQEQAPPDTGWIGSRRLQVSIEMPWIGAPAFNEGGSYGDRVFRNFAKAAPWIAHETTHRWGMELRFRNPLTGQEQPLADSLHHWLDNLNTAAFVPVLDHYLTPAGPGNSIMGGADWVENADGTFLKTGHPWGMPGGFSALDLYAMGLLPPEEVPDTFLLQDLKQVGVNRYRGTKVPVRIQDILPAMGPRNPASAQAQNEFRMAVYLVHEPGRAADPAMVARAGQVALAAADFFESATGGRMKIVYSRLNPGTPDDVFPPGWPPPDRVEIPAIACAQGAGLHSMEASTPTTLEFINASSQTIQVYWIDYTGKPALPQTLDPLESSISQTFLTHPFMVTDLNGQCHGYYLPAKQPGRVIIRDPK
jgi:von Hippel-Lindau disease tumor suppressor protein